MQRLDWSALLGGAPPPPEGSEIRIAGHVLPAPGSPPGYLLLLPEPACCAGCRPEPDSTIEVLADGPVPRAGQVEVAGIWHSLPPDDGAGWRWQIRGAKVRRETPWLGRRAMLAAPLLCAVPRLARAQASPAAGRAVLDAAPAMDLHSHAGHVSISRVRDRPFTPLAAPMREGGMGLIALAMVADTPTTHVTTDHRIEAFRDPAPGELWAHGQAAMARLHALVAQDGLAVVTDRGTLARAPRPAVVVASEGADFLEGRIERLDWAFQQRLRHLQLTHYRVNELGDIQTAASVHGGLTDFGAEVIHGCNRLGIVVDVAHGTLPLVQRAASVTTKPLVLSHTALSGRPGPRSRLITAEHAKLVAGTGGVVGVWPLVGASPSAWLYAQSVARMVDAVGIDHVGIGSDMLGLLSKGALEDYRATPDLAAALLQVGFDAAGAAKLLGGNYARVLAATLPG